MNSSISMSGISGKKQEEVFKALNSYFVMQNKELKETGLNTEIYKLFLISGDNNNSVILYPEYFSDVEEVTLYLEQVFNTPIINFYVYGVDLWMYEIYYNGKIVDKFNPLPKYIEEIKKNELQSYRGNPAVLCSYFNNIKLSEIKEYYRPWTDKLILNRIKAYPNDEFFYGDKWQVVDFMRKLNFKYPIIDEEETIGRAFKLI